LQGEYEQFNVKVLCSNQIFFIPSFMHFHFVSASYPYNSWTTWQKKCYNE